MSFDSAKTAVFVLVEKGSTECVCVQFLSCSHELFITCDCNQVLDKYEQYAVDRNVIDRIVRIDGYVKETRDYLL